MIRISKSVIRIWISVSIPKCYRSTTLALGKLIRILSRIRSRIRILIRICKSVVRIHGSVSQWYGSADPDPNQNVTDLQHTAPRNADLDPVLWNRNYFLRFRFRFQLLKSYGSGSGSGYDFWKSYGSGSGSYFWKVTVPVPVLAPYLYHKRQIFHKKICFLFT